MKYYPTNHIKNVALIGGSKSGKTSLAECMMFEGGVLSRMGSVEQGNTVSDYHEIELDRGTSVFSSILHTEWRGNKINLIDTPGLDDFIGEVVSTLRICDTALVVLNAARGVEVGTEIHWRYLRRYNKPSIFVVNQVDHPKSNFQSTVEQAKSTFGDGVVVMQYPYNEGEN
ncbi:MAG: GTP-binding protein, partial [Bacteroidota bacterium]